MGKTAVIGMTLLQLLAQQVAADVYVVIYATCDGKTGHAGIAIDRYAVRVRDCAECPSGVQEDTVRTGELRYYDLWPAKDQFSKQRLFENIPGVLYRLPASSAEMPVTVASLIRKGIPHQNGYPCDGLLRIRTDRVSDRALEDFLDQLCSQPQRFHAVDNNCADFVEKALEFLLRMDIKADERVFMDIYATTPNQLYKSLSRLPEVQVIKDPGNRINGSFWEEKIVKW